MRARSFASRGLVYAALAAASSERYAASASDAGLLAGLDVADEDGACEPVLGSGLNVDFDVGSEDDEIVRTLGLVDRTGLLPPSVHAAASSTANVTPAIVSAI